MKVMVLVKATPSSEAGHMPSEQLLMEMGRFNEELVRAGLLKAGEGLKPSAKGARVRFSGADRFVSPGPFAATSELVAGYWIWEVRSMQEAIDWVKRCPNPMPEESEIEIRPLYEMADFAASDPTGAVSQHEDALRAEIESGGEDRAEIRRIMAAWSRALEARDLDGLMADYAPDCVLYDAIPPYKVVGADAIRKLWESCLPHFPANFQSEHRDIVIHVDGNTAIMHGLHHFLPTPPDHPSGHTWMRVTVGYRRIDGKWKVVHEHISVPFNPMTGQVWYIPNPDRIETVDWSSQA
ncbi:MAG: SgcJ/EcaC family oxidoreductase [Gemmataceae bacterium]